MINSRKHKYIINNLAGSLHSPPRASALKQTDADDWVVSVVLCTVASDRRLISCAPGQVRGPVVAVGVDAGTYKQPIYSTR